MKNKFKSNIKKNPKYFEIVVFWVMTPCAPINVSEEPAAPTSLHFTIAQKNTI
jgi:hypothetical protein